MTIKKNFDHVISIVIKKELYDKIMSECEKNEDTVSHYLRELIKEKLNGNIK
jgi:predicted DNA-binding protein